MPANCSVDTLVLSLSACDQVVPFAVFSTLRWTNCRGSLSGQAFSLFAPRLACVGALHFCVAERRPTRPLFRVGQAGNTVSSRLRVL